MGGRMDGILQEQLNTWDNTVKGEVTEQKVSVSLNGDVVVETMLRLTDSYNVKLVVLHLDIADVA